MNKHIFGGAKHFFYLVNGEAYGWGNNFCGQLGIGKEDDYVSKPTKVKDLKNIVQIACGEDHTLFLLKSGQVYAAGRNFYGQLGVIHEIIKKTAVPIQLNFGRDDITYLECGISCSFAVSKNNNVYAFGRNNLKQLGIINPNNKERFFEPTLVSLLSDKNIIKVFTAKSSSFPQTFFVSETGSIHWRFGKVLGQTFSDLNKIEGLNNVNSIAVCGFTNFYLQNNKLISQQYKNANNFSPPNYTKFKNYDVKSISAWSKHSIVLYTNGSLGMLKDGKMKYALICYTNIKEVVAGKDSFLVLDENNNLFQCNYDKPLTSDKKIASLFIL